MATDMSLWGLFANASLLVKAIMVFLLGLSILSWTVIFQRARFMRDARKAMRLFEEQFWSGGDLSKLYEGLTGRGANASSISGIAHICYAGFKEFLRLRKKDGNQGDKEALMEGTQRCMRVALSRETEKLEAHLSFLATVGSVTPYIGLFGTVWGIMHAFMALGNVQQATLSLVAPGIAEALVATAMGLFAAIPAVVAYNRYSHISQQLITGYETFQEEFVAILHRQVHAAALV